MDRFVSNYTLRLDAKGRVSIPAPFRGVLVRDGFEGLYCYPTLDQPAIDAGGNALLADIESADCALSALCERARRIPVALYGTSETLKLDGEGRVGPHRRTEAPCRHHRGGAFVGLGHKFQIWEPGRFRAHLAEATGTVRAVKSRAPGWRRTTRTKHGNDGGPRRQATALPLADRLVIFPCSPVRLFDFLQPRDGGIYHRRHVRRRRLRARHPRVGGTRVIGIDRDHTAIADGFRSGREPRADGSRLWRTVSPISRHSRAASATTRSMASCSISACRRCSSTTPERGFSFRQ